MTEFMTDEQEQHLSRIKNDFVQRMDLKYRLGSAEHGGNLIGMAPLKLIDEAINECLDLYAFLLTTREDMEKRRESEQNNYKVYESKEAE